MTEYDILNILGENPQPAPQAPTPPVEPKDKNLITKAVAAQEVMNQLKIIKILTLISMAGVFLTLIAYTLYPIAGAVVAIGLVVYLAIQSKNSNKLATILKQKYRVN